MYSSHGVFMTLREFYDTEVVDRENYTDEEYRNILKESGYNPNSWNMLCIWVTPDPEIAKSYMPSKHEGGVHVVDTSEGLVLYSFNDGDEGYLYIDHKPSVVVTRENFIEWFFFDEDLSDIISKAALKFDLIQSGEFIITAQELLDSCGSIPEHIVENPRMYPKDRDVEGSECILIY